MCGIVGILDNRPAAPLLLDALKRLEYRGYDSAGIATLEGGRLARRRAEGKLANLVARVEAEPLSGTSGIGHTRWATHGAPTERNAHPHTVERVAVVHNGIIENFRSLRDEIAAAGRTLETDTDTEVVAHLMAMELDSGKQPAQAFSRTLKRLKGAFALAVLIDDETDLLLAARRGSPLAIGYGDGAMYVGSDAIALAPFTDQLSYLEDGDWAVMTRDGAVICDETGSPVQRPRVHAVASSQLVDKGSHRHFMAKEIHEQPEVVSHTLAHYLDFSTGQIVFHGAESLDFSACERLVITACGTAYYAGMIAKYWFERLAGITVDIDVASEFRYRAPPLVEGSIALFVSQSGETADTLASLRYCSAAGLTRVSIVNVPSSTIARESDVVLPTLAGPEIGVASTKAFTCQLAVLFALALHAAVQRGRLSEADICHYVGAAESIPGLLAESLQLEPRIEKLARDLSRTKHVLYLGRGTSYPLALEGALKLKEISYIHAEGYAAGELKHGPIALIDRDLPVIVIAPRDAVFEKTVSNVQEVAARGGKLILLTDLQGEQAFGIEDAETIVVPDMEPVLSPLVYALPIQLIAYHTAVFMGTDVDQPRNLAKSVTVE